jgi:hypothetical protein
MHSCRNGSLALPLHTLAADFAVPNEAETGIPDSSARENCDPANVIMRS